VVLDLSHLEKAVRQLEKSLSYLNSELARNDSELRDQFRAASIQAFEFTYELAVKLLRRQLEQIVPNPSELRALAFMELIRTGAEAGLVEDVARYRLYREKRNITSHTYDEELAEDVISVVAPFLADARQLLAELKRRNPSEDAY
jgi:nucleotidyltransferase substrate binding protein (TIGR01987 family)